MNAALIDLHVRVGDGGPLNLNALVEAAHARGLDGVVVVGDDEAPNLERDDDGPNGVGVYQAVELDTELGQLICVPAQVDEWFTGAEWKALALPTPAEPDGATDASGEGELSPEAQSAAEAAGGSDDDANADETPDQDDDAASLADALVAAVAESAPEPQEPRRRRSRKSKKNKRRDLPPRYAGDAIVSAFVERGGVVVVAQPYDRDLAHQCREDAFVGEGRLAGVVVTSSPRHTTSNERAAHAAVAAKLPGAAGSASTIGGNRFGTVATLFPRRPGSQEALVHGLRSGRFWPVEIAGRVKAPNRKDKDKAGDKDKDKDAAQASKPEPKEKKSKKKNRKTKEDNRGNQLDMVRLARPVDNPYDGRQPEFDPIARLYGMHDKRKHALNGKSDAELDRINGNRSSGPDPNIMRGPDFRELRAERQHVNLLLQTIDTQRQQDRDSIALRFAVTALGRDANDSDIDYDAFEPMNDGKRKKRRRRRRR